MHALALTAIMAAAPLPGAGSADELAALLRGLLLNALPDPLHADASKWGRMRTVANGITWRGQGLGVRPVIQRKPKEDGLWKRLTVQALLPQETLTLAIADVRQAELGKTTFDVLLSCEARARYEQQLWENGLRLYSGETRARFRVWLALKCELTYRVEKGGKLLIPDAVFRVRATDAQLRYDNLVVEHTAGVGGELARLLGDAALETVKGLRPGLEKELLEKGNAAVVKAADTKEVRVSLAKLVEKAVK